METEPAHSHTCCICGDPWDCDRTRKKCESSGTANAARVNGIGPFCQRCRHGIMFLRLTTNENDDSRISPSEAIAEAICRIQGYEKKHAQLGQMPEHED